MNLSLFRLYCQFEDDTGTRLERAFFGISVHRRVCSYSDCSRFPTSASPDARFARGSRRRKKTCEVGCSTSAYRFASGFRDGGRRGDAVRRA